MRELALVVSGNSPQVHCMWDSALSKLSEGLTTSSESLLGEKASDKLWLKKENIYIYISTCISKVSAHLLASAPLFASTHLSSFGHSPSDRG